MFSGYIRQPIYGIRQPIYGCSFHPEKPVQGFCLSYDCTNLAFCIDCLINENHQNCKKKQNCKQFNEILEEVNESLQYLEALKNELHTLQENFQTNFKAVEKILNSNLEQQSKIKENLIQENYSEVRGFGFVLKDWHDFYSKDIFDSLKENNFIRKDLHKIMNYIESMKHNNQQPFERGFLRQSITKQPQNAKLDLEAKLNEGVELMMKKQWQQACDTFEIIKQSNSQNCENLFYYSISCIEINQLQKSYEMIQELEKLDRSFYTNRLNRIEKFKTEALCSVIQGITLSKQQLNVSAKQQFMKAIKIDPSLECKLLFQSENLYEAQNNIEIALDKNENYAVAYFTLGLILMENQILKQALVNFNKVLTFDKQYAKAYYFKSSIQRSLGQKTEALQSYQLAQDYLHPCDSSLSQKLHQLYENLTRQ